VLSLHWALLGLTASMLFVACPSAADTPRFPKAAAARVASLTPAQCRAELTRRHVETRPASGSYPGVATPLRLSGALHGVRFRTPGVHSRYGVLDCRLVLALDDFANLLAELDVKEVHVDNFYRSHAHLPGRRDKPSQHAYGLAADIYGFVLRDGRSLVVERDWNGALGEDPCEDARAREGSSEPAVLRSIVCGALERGLFHHLLTPNSNSAHHNHLHFDIARSHEHRVKQTRPKRRRK
jgi:hypothetical protein